MKVTIEINAPKITNEQIRKFIHDAVPNLEFEPASKGRIVGKTKTGEFVTVTVEASPDEILEAMTVL